MEFHIYLIMKIKVKWKQCQTVFFFYECHSAPCSRRYVLHVSMYCLASSKCIIFSKDI